MENNLSSPTEWSPGNGGFSGDTASRTDATANTDDAFTQTAHEYTDRISDVMSQAKDYLGETMNTVSGKIKEFATDDLSGMALKAKNFARQNPGQAILVSAAAGVLLGLIIRGRR
jgi:ElaB/YqjD/DUF883 family membrane-anchored ribosome-binding protein